MADVEPMERSADNCPFYPACYIAGDCGVADWKTGDCGLPRDEQLRRSAGRFQALRLQCDRHKIGERLMAEAMAGKHDHLIETGGPTK